MNLVLKNGIWILRANGRLFKSLSMKEALEKLSELKEKLK